MKTCSICGKDILPPKILYCSAKCKQKAHFNKHFKSNPNTSYSQFKRADIRKKELILLKGNKCNKCGYNKNYAALCFHHTCCKNFSLDSRNIGNRSWKSLLAEAENTVLLCSNCHMELHYPSLIL